MGAPGARVAAGSGRGSTRREAAGGAVLAAWAKSPSCQAWAESRGPVWSPLSPSDSGNRRPDPGSRTAGLLPTLRRRTGRDQDREAVSGRDPQAAGRADRVSYSLRPVQALRPTGTGSASAPDLGCGGQRGVATGGAGGGAGQRVEQGIGAVVWQDGGGVGHGFPVAGEPRRSSPSLAPGSAESRTHLPRVGATNSWLTQRDAGRNRLESGRTAVVDVGLLQRETYGVFHSTGPRIRAGDSGPGG